MTLSNTKVLFIAGLGHSGSTAFDLLLGAQKGITGLGEIDTLLNPSRRKKYIKRYNKYPCTCGSKTDKCIVWGEYKNIIEKSYKYEYNEMYKKLIKIVLKKSNTKIVVDSSKNIDALKIVYENIDRIGIGKQNLYVVHLTKDIRNHYTSAIYNTNLENKKYKTILDWIIKNRNIDNYLKSKSIKSMNIGYEEISLSTSYILNKVFEFLEHKIDEKEVNIAISKSHIISGNNMRLYQSEKLYYDYRWLLNRELYPTYTLLPFLNRLNMKWVYSNVKDSLLSKSKFKALK